MSWYPSDPTERCVVQNSANFSYEDFACLYEKSLGLTMTSFEEKYNPIHVRDWMTERPWVPVVAILGYGAMIAIGKTYFAKRDAWSWRTTLAVVRPKRRGLVWATGVWLSMAIRVASEVLSAPPAMSTMILPMFSPKAS